MPAWEAVTRNDVLNALAEADSLGPQEFAQRYRFGRSGLCSVWHRGHEYDGTALLGVAYLRATGAVAAREDLAHTTQVADRLRESGLDVVVDEDAVAQVQAKAAAAPRRAAATKPTRAAKATTAPKAAAARRTAAKATEAAPRRRPSADAPVKVCQRCYMALPATGICDNCD
jgi:hypothetical protein